MQSTQQQQPVNPSSYPALPSSPKSHHQVRYNRSHAHHQRATSSSPPLSPHLSHNLPISSPSRRTTNKTISHQPLDTDLHLSSTLSRNRRKPVDYKPHPLLLLQSIIYPLLHLHLLLAPFLNSINIQEVSPNNWTNHPTLYSTLPLNTFDA
ncbi:hypothetical protein BC829DRAFT_134056 [Chytridium lagenaria]|nr:hypothetical protein BC829DRAFT_134056 [Chytridium lagenaria]